MKESKRMLEMMRWAKKETKDKREGVRRAKLKRQIVQKVHENWNEEFCKAVFNKVISDQIIT